MRKKSANSSTIIVDMGYYDEDDAETLGLGLVIEEIRDQMSADVREIHTPEEVDSAIKDFAECNDGDPAYAVVIEVKRIIKYHNKEVTTKLVTEEMKLV